MEGSVSDSAVSLHRDLTSVDCLLCPETDFCCTTLCSKILYKLKHCSLQRFPGKPFEGGTGLWLHSAAHCWPQCCLISPGMLRPRDSWVSQNFKPGRLMNTEAAFKRGNCHCQRLVAFCISSFSLASTDLSRWLAKKYKNRLTLLNCLDLSEGSVRSLTTVLQCDDC